MKNAILLLGFAATSLTSCIKEDIVEDLVDPKLTITTSKDSIKVGSTVKYSALYTNNAGKSELVDLVWSSSDTNIVSVNNLGEVHAKNKGVATISVTANNLTDSDLFGVGNTTICETVVEKSGTLIAASGAYKLKGDFTIEQQGNDLLIKLANNYESSTNIPRFYVYLSNNPNNYTSAKEVSRVTSFNGEHSYTVKNTSINDYKYLLYYCILINAKIGHGEIK